jgi:superfamily I DNA/RNA helicase
MLVLSWAKRAADRGERTLVVCFNKPIANLLQQELETRDVMVSTFHDAVLQLLEPHGFRVGEKPTPEYWRDALTDALAFHAAAVGTPFDTIIVDEAQDFHPHWLAALEGLLDRSGHPRFLLAADPAQAVYVTPWSPPDDMVTMPLVYNLRNCSSVARVVQKLGGPVPLPSAPHGDAVVHLHAGGHKEIRKRVRDAVRRFTDEFHVPFSQIAVLTTRTDVRDELFRNPPDGCALSTWEQRGEDTVLCETVHRTKGLERTAVVLVDVSGEPNPVLLYVGASRAVSSLCLVGTPALAQAAGVSAGPSSSV